MDKRAEEYQEKLADIETTTPDRQQNSEALGAEYGVEPGTPWIRMDTTQVVMNGAANFGKQNGMPVMSTSPPRRSLAAFA